MAKTIEVLENKKFKINEVQKSGAYYADIAYVGSRDQPIRTAIYQRYGLKYRYKKPIHFLSYVKAEDLMGNKGYYEINLVETPDEQAKKQNFWSGGKIGKNICAQINEQYYRHYLKHSIINLSGFLGIILGLAYCLFLLSLFSFIPAVLISFWGIGDHTWSGFGHVFFFNFIFLLSLFTIWKGTGWLLRFFPAQPGNSLNRRTGMLEISRLFRKPQQIPFVELIPCMYANGGVTVHYAHPLTQKSYVDAMGMNHIDIIPKATFLEQFMDVSKPLPDVPYLEVYRHLDPTTVEFDKATNRNPRFWRDKTKEEIAAIAKARREAMEEIFGGGAFSL
jgi:hypothetical protein